MVKRASRLLRAVAGLGLAAGAHAGAVPVVAPPFLPGLQSYAGLVGGSLALRDSAVTATTGCFILCVQEHATHEVHFSGGDTAGLRAGVWGSGQWRFAGGALEVANTVVRGEQVDMRFTSVTLAPLIRLPLFPSGSAPGGHVSLYAGPFFTGVLEGSLSVRFPELPHMVSGVLSGRGNGMLAGAALQYRQLSVQAEYRTLGMSLSLADVYDSGEARLDARQAVVGLAWSF